MTPARGRTAFLVLACLTMQPPHPAGAQDRTPTPSAAELREAYPLRPGPTPGAERSGVPSGSGTGSVWQQPADGAPAASESVAPIALLAVFAFVAALGMRTLPMYRRRRDSPPQTVTSPAHENGSQASHTAADRRTNGRAPGPDPDVSLPAALVPPDRHRRWTATIEWRQPEAAPHFSVVARAARGATETVLANSGPVEWPPKTPASVQALGAAAAKLETSLVAAGWEKLPPGREWYAKRFSWEPAAKEPSGSPAASQPGSSRFARRAG